MYKLHKIMMLSVILMTTIVSVDSSVVYGRSTKKTASHDDRAVSPDEVVRKTVDALLTVIKGKRTLFKKDPEAFFRELDAILEPDVDFDYLARGVMGRYARLVDDKKFGQFKVSFKKSLVSFYGRALLSYDNQKISVNSLSKRVKGDSQVPVSMTITTASGTTYPLIYTMSKDGGARWKIRNMAINGINIGKLFRAQFREAVQKYRNTKGRASLEKNTKKLSEYANGEEGSVNFVVDFWPQIIQPVDPTNR